MKTLQVRTYRESLTGREMLEATCDGLKLSVSRPMGLDQLQLTPVERAWYAAECWLELHGAPGDKFHAWAEGFMLNVELGVGVYTFTRLDGRKFRFGSAKGPAEAK